jgi:hypothetical protein
MLQKITLSLMALTSLAVSSYAHLGLSKTECDALYNQFPSRTELPNSFIYHLQGIDITITFNGDRAIAISYYAPLGLSERQIGILAEKNNVDWNNLTTVPIADSWLDKNKLAEKRPHVDELYDPFHKEVHVTVTEHKQYIDIVTTAGENFLAAYYDQKAKESLKEL